MTERPSFKGFRSPDGTRKERIALYREHIRDAQSGVDTSLSSADWQTSIDVMEGELGKAWDRVAQRLGELVLDADITKNSATVELLLIVKSLAETVDGSEDIDEVMGYFEPVFNSQKASDNSAASKPSPEARWWVCAEWANRKDPKQSKRAFAREYRVLVKKKFDVLITEETIYRDWLKGRD